MGADRSGTDRAWKCCCRFVSRKALPLVGLAVLLGAAGAISGPPEVLCVPGLCEIRVTTSVELRDSLSQIRSLLEDPPSGLQIIKVTLAAGDYELVEPLAISPETIGPASGSCKVLFVGEANSSARLVGGRRIPPETWKTRETSGFEWSKAIPKKCKAVRAVDLSGILPEDFALTCTLTRDGTQTSSEPFFYGPGLELFCNGKRMPLARYPNAGRLHVHQTISDTVFIHREAAVAVNEWPFRFLTRLRKWEATGSAWLHGVWGRGEWTAHYRLESILGPAVSLGVMESDDAIGQTEFGCERCCDSWDLKPGALPYALSSAAVRGLDAADTHYAYNIPSELDAPGEWFLDRDRSVLYFYPPADLQEAEVIVSVSDHLIVMTDVEDVEFKNLVLEASQDHAVTMAGCIFCGVRECEIRNAGGWGVVVQGGQVCSIVGCDIHHTGAGGVFLGSASSGAADDVMNSCALGCSGYSIRDRVGCVELSQARRSLTPTGHVLSNCHIHHFGRWHRTHRAGVEITGVGMSVSHNLIHDGPHTGIWFHLGNDHEIRHNEIYDVCQETDDSGAIMADRDWTSRGTVVRDNYVHHCMTAAGIYLDDGFSGTTIESNILHGGLRFGVLIGGGRDNVVIDNVFLECHRGIHIDNRLMEQEKLKFVRDEAELKCCGQSQAMYLGSRAGELQMKLDQLFGRLTTCVPNGSDWEEDCACSPDTQKPAGILREDLIEPVKWTAWDKAGYGKTLRDLEKMPDSEQAMPAGSKVSGNLFVGDSWEAVLHIEYLTLDPVPPAEDVKYAICPGSVYEKTGANAKRRDLATDPDPLCDCAFVAKLVTRDEIQNQNGNELGANYLPAELGKRIVADSIGLEPLHRTRLLGEETITVAPKSGSVATTVTIRGIDVATLPEDTQVRFWHQRSFSSATWVVANGDLEVTIPVIPTPGGRSTQVYIEVDVPDSHSRFIPFEVVRGILFTHFPEGSNSASDFEVWVINPDGSRQSRLTDVGDGGSAASWSPDGTRIAFHRVAGETFQIHAMDADGTSVRQVTTDPTSVSGWLTQPHWSLDGEWVVFSDARGGNAKREVHKLRLINLGEGPLTEGQSSVIQLTDNTVWNTDPRWYEEGIVFSRRCIDSYPPEPNAILVMSDVGGGASELDLGFPEPESLAEAKHTSVPVWSEAVNAFACTRYHVLSILEEASTELHVISADSGIPELVLTTSGTPWTYVGSLCWSPDGTQLAFTGAKEDEPPYHRQVYVMDLPTGVVEQLTTGAGDSTVSSWAD